VVPVEIVLLILAIPPILTNTYAGVQNVDPAVRDAATGMGMTGGQVLRKVELPIALPLIMSGFRSAVLQVIATATIAAFLPFLGGLGYLIFNGLPQINDPNVGYPAMLGAGIVVAVLAVVADLLLLGVQRLLVSPGVSGHFRVGPSQALDDVGASVEVSPVNA
jgi:osmoprotectant transport system permease protein